MKVEERLREVGSRVRLEVDVPSSIPRDVVRGIRVRQLGVVSLALSLIGILALAGFAIVQTQPVGEGDSELSPSQGGDPPEIITRVEIDGHTDIIRMYKDDPTLSSRWNGNTFLVTLLGPDHLDRWGLASFPLEDDLEPKFRMGKSEWRIYGAVSDRVAKVTARLTDGSVIEGELFPIPEEFETNAQAFVIKMDAPRTGGEIAVVDANGTLIESEKIPAS